MIQTIPSAFALRLFEEITFHTFEFGGTTVEIYGSKGSAKTTLMLKIAEKVHCESYKNGVEKEKVIWRGRDVDQWNWYPGKDVRVFVFYEDDVKFYYEDGRRVDIEYSRYKNFDDILSNLGEFNVVYEPKNYIMPNELLEIIKRRAPEAETVKGAEHVLTEACVDSSIWWFDFLYYLLHSTNRPRFISVMIDEADEVFPELPSGLRWHLQLWFKDIVKDLRKRNISLYFSAHSFSDVDFRIRSKVQYRILLKGAKVPKNSLINKTAPLFLPLGKAFIERDGFGIFAFDKLPTKQKILMEKL
ncbi:MAG: hypothetical protein RMH75_07240 [Archaeoglobaceae archaeon]|nr:hypothetical protein [Archaeoglobaceae archaeon]